MSDSGTPAPKTPPPAAAPTGANRRLAERKVLRGAGQMHFTGHSPLNVRIFDVSVGGMAVICAVNPPPAAVCVVQFFVVLKNGRVPVQVNAKVAHSVFSGSEGGFKVGLQFLNPSTSVVATLRHYIEG